MKYRKKVQVQVCTENFGYDWKMKNVAGIRGLYLMEINDINNEQ
jgi:hypothetical protein